MLPFAPGITCHYTEQDDKLSLELRSLRKLKTENFITQDKTVINTIKGEFSPILEDYLGDSIPGFSDAFMEMQSHPIPLEGEEREFEIFDGVKMKFCWIPAGKATLGSPKSEKGRYRDEEEREFETNGFWMGKYPVTRIQWKDVRGNKSSDPISNGGNSPKENVSWYDCQEFIRKCNISGLMPQLPHEDQWEYACRGGRGNKQPFYWGDALNGDKANCHGDIPYGTSEKGRVLYCTTNVGSYEKVAPHPWGLCDILGNVWEWCDNTCLEASPHVMKIIRGGCWRSASVDCRSALRSRSVAPRMCYDFIGFRLIIC